MLKAAVLATVVLPAFGLSRVMARVSKDHPDWSADRLEKAEREYRRFVALSKLDGETGLLQPSHDADIVWHTHLLHTKQYAADCQEFLGRFLHHNPFDDEVRAFAPTHMFELYRRVFGNDFVPEVEAECTNCCDCANC